MRRYEYEHRETGERVSVRPEEKDAMDMAPQYRRVWGLAGVHYHADGFYSTHDDPKGRFQRARRAARAKARKNNQDPPESKRIRKAAARRAAEEA